MSHYTTEVRFICENASGLTESEGYNNVSEIIEKARTNIFSFDFPIFDEAYRSVLETKILKHYYTREIGFETVGLWKLKLDTKLNEIMPYYNKLYSSELLEFNPLYDVDYQIKRDDSYKYDETNSNVGTSKNIRTDNLNEATSATTHDATDTTRTDDLAHHDSTSTSNTQYDLYSDTPQGGLTGVDNENYLTSARKITNSGSETNDGTNTGTQRTVGTEDITSTGNKANTGTQTHDGNTTDNGTKNYTNVDDYLEHVYGKRSSATYSSMLQEYRETFLNIDMQVINELNDLFMNIW